MAIHLSKQQQAVVNCTEPRIIVKACPGSGKTFSVAARMARLLRENNLSRHQGIAAISFTNTACEVIKKELKDTFDCSNISYPSFIGTIDSFINTYIFLPYAHLEMKCPCRPEIVGTEFNKWYDYDASKRNYDGTKITDPNYFVDKVSFDLNGDPIPLVPAKEFNFSWSKMRNANGQYRKDVASIIEAKHIHFAKGKANQADANFIAYRILTQYPSIIEKLVARFPIFIIDEAQDTTELQMAIIDLIVQAEPQSVMLIGDPDQAIFEWNTANPSLFIAKYNSPHWHSLQLSENRRSSENICQLANRFWGNTMNSIAKDKDYVEHPRLLAHTDTLESIRQIADEFISKCQELRLNESEYAIVYRGQSFGATYFGLANSDNSAGQSSPWVNGYYYVRDIVYGKYLIDQGKYTEGLAFIEKGCYKQKKQVRYVSASTIRSAVTEIGFRQHRENILKFIQKLPPTNKTLSDWITEVRQAGLNFTIQSNKANISIESLFRRSDCNLQQDRPYLRTIHSVKGMTLEAVLIFLKKQSGTKNYATILGKTLEQNDAKDNEELRIVYVACTRPKKLLWIAVPSDDLECWNTKLMIEK